MTDIPTPDDESRVPRRDQKAVYEQMREGVEAEWQYDLPIPGDESLQKDLEPSCSPGLAFTDTVYDAIRETVWSVETSADDDDAQSDAAE